MTNEAYIRSLEERIEILETIINAVLRYDFPDDNGVYRSYFNLYADFMYNPYKKDDNLKNAIDQLEYTIKREADNEHIQ